MVQITRIIILRVKHVHPNQEELNVQYHMFQFFYFWWIKMMKPKHSKTKKCEKPKVSITIGCHSLKLKIFKSQLYSLAQIISSAAAIFKLIIMVPTYPRSHCFFLPIHILLIDLSSKKIKPCQIVRTKPNVLWYQKSLCGKPNPLLSINHTQWWQ